jgi:tRNA (cytidine/uridine-2'-O-)-methyltransferase
MTRPDDAPAMQGRLRQNSRVFHVVLYQPQIPGNTGNVIRLCANSGCRLHLVEPLGFRLDRRSVRRAALDYEELTVVQTHASLADCRRHIETAASGTKASCAARWFAIETGGGRLYSQASFCPGDVLLFGPETAGLPAEVLQGLPETRRLQLPMKPGNRSVNLSNCVALVVYEAWRQNGFGGAAALPSS